MMLCVHDLKRIGNAFQMRIKLSYLSIQLFDLFTHVLPFIITTAFIRVHYVTVQLPESLNIIIETAGIYLHIVIGLNDG